MSSQGTTHILLGVILIGLGLLTWLKQMTAILHGYHYRNVKEEDIPAYTRQMGIGEVIVGAGLCLTGLLRFFTVSFVSWLPFVAASLVGFTMMDRAQKKYNGSWFR